MTTEGTISLRDLLKKLNRFEKLDLANKCGTSLGYLRKLAYGQCEPSLSMFRKLNTADPRLTVDSFFRSEDKPSA
jgi:predicted transcriptional regulator